MPEQSFLRGILKGGKTAQDVFVSQLDALAKFSKEGAEVKANLMNGNLQTEDVMLYNTKPFTDADTSKAMFKSGESKVPGRRNVKDRTIDDDKPTLVFAIGIEYSLADEVTGVFVPANVPAALLDGEFIWRISDKKTIETGMHLFSLPDGNSEESRSKMLLYVLENPKWLIPNKTIDFDISLIAGLGASATNQHQVRVSFFGISTNTVNALN